MDFGANSILSLILMGPGQQFKLGMTQNQQFFLFCFWVEQTTNLTEDIFKLVFGRPLVAFFCWMSTAANYLSCQLANLYFNSTDLPVKETMDFLKRTADLLWGPHVLHVARSVHRLGQAKAFQVLVSHLVNRVGLGFFFTFSLFFILYPIYIKKNPIPNTILILPKAQPFVF